MKYKLSNVSQEFLGIFTLILFTPLILLGLGALSAYIEANKKKNRTPEDKLKDTINELLRHDKWLEPGNYDHFPEKYGMSDSEADNKNGGHWCVDPNKKNPNIVAHDVVSLKTYLDIASKFEILVSAVASAKSSEDCTNITNNKLKQVFSLNEVKVTENGVIEKFKLKSGDVKWPDSEFYKDADDCIKKLQESLKTLVPHYKKLVVIIHDALNKPTKDCSKEELVARVSFIKACEKITDLHSCLVSDFEENFYRLAEIDVGFMNEDGTFDYL